MNNETLRTIYHQLQDVQGQLEDLAEENEALSDVADSVNDAIDELEDILQPEEIQISIRRKGEAGSVSLNKDGIVKLLAALQKDEDEDEDEDEDDTTTLAILEGIRILNESLTREELDAAIVRIQDAMRG